MVFVLALGAALANALTSVFQRMAVESAPASTTLRLSLLAYALRRRIWLLGFALMIVSFLCQAVALHLGRLSQVQPILTTELVFLVIVLASVVVTGIAFAIPKSSTFTQMRSPGFCTRKTFAGFKSRCTSPRPWASATASRS